MLGSWFLTKEQYNSYIKEGEAGLRRLRSELSIPDLPTKVSEAVIPVGNTIKIGVARKAFGGDGEGIQYFFDDVVDVSWFKNTIEVGKLIE